MKSIVFSCMLLLWPQISIAQNISVNGLEEFRVLYRNLVQDQSANIPVPSLFIVDSKTNTFLSNQQMVDLLNQSNDLPPVALIPQYLQSDSSQIKVSKIPEDLMKSNRYIAIYFNPEPHLVSMMNKMLKVNMSKGLELITQRLAHIDGVIIYNSRGVYSHLLNK